MSSLPVPDSPEINTDACVGAACSITRYTLRIIGLFPMMRPKLPTSRSWRRRCRTSRNVSCRSTAFFRRICSRCGSTGLRQIVVRALLDGFDGAFDGPLRGEQDDRDIGQLIVKRPQKLESAHARHHEVADDDCGPERGDLAEGFLAVRRLIRVEAPCLHELGKSAASRRVVLDDQHSLRLRRARRLLCFVHQFRMRLAPTRQPQWEDITRKVRITR